MRTNRLAASSMPPIGIEPSTHASAKDLNRQCFGAWHHAQPSDMGQGLKNF